MSIKEKYQITRKKIPDDVTIVLAAKKRTAEEVAEAIDAGATDIGENYVQEAQKMYEHLGEKANIVRWHLIGSLQKNKINTALSIFDVIQTVGDFSIAEGIDKRVEKAGKKVIPGVEPEYKSILGLIKKISGNLKHLKVEGLMTMGPRFGDPEESRLYFKKTKEIFDEIKMLDLPNVSMKALSMGMSNSYKVAIEEGSNMVRIGSAVFGER
jgi:pyridoxal phosphate enzyme (YggS family)